MSPACQWVLSLHDTTSLHHAKLNRENAASITETKYWKLDTIKNPDDNRIFCKNDHIRHPNIGWANSRLEKPNNSIQTILSLFNLTACLFSHLPTADTWMALWFLSTTKGQKLPLVLQFFLWTWISLYVWFSIWSSNLRTWNTKWRHPYANSLSP